MLPLDMGTRVSAFQVLALGEEVTLTLCPKLSEDPRGEQGWASFLRREYEAGESPPLPPESPFTAGFHTAQGPTARPAQPLPHLGIP